MPDNDRTDLSTLNRKVGDAYAALRDIGRARALTFGILGGLIVVFSLWAIIQDGWELFAQRVTDGLTNGFIYAAMALALVLIYKATTVVNFAQGEMAMFGTFIAYIIFHDWGWPVGVAIPLAMVISGVLAAGLERVLIRPFDPSNHLAITIATLSLFLILNGLAGVIWGFDGKGFPSAFPLRNEKFSFLGAEVEWTRAFIALTVLVAVVLVTMLLNKTKIGLAFRAVSSNLESSRLTGVHIGRTIQFGWAIAAAMGTLAGCLYAQTTPIDPNFMGRLLVFSFAAATLGGLDSLGGAIVGGLIVGMVQTMVGGYIDAVGSELATGTALVVIIVILTVKPTGLFGSEKVERV
jgi:branched-chain amino acid transport system permease protein